MPEDEPVATGPVETGAFGDVGGGETAIEGRGSGVARRLVLAAAEGFKAEEPTLVVELEEVPDPDFSALCAGDEDLVATTGDPDRDVCGGKDAAVGLLLARDVVVYVNRDSLLRLELEGLIQYAVDNGETLPQELGAEPLTLEELQETQTKLEQVIAGVA